MRTPILVIAVAALLGFSAGAPADSLGAESKAKGLCAGCHGPTGISINPLWPNLAGQKDQYLIKTMREYRDGQRQDPNMLAIAQTLTDEEITDLAAYYAALDPAG